MYEEDLRGSIFALQTKRAIQANAAAAALESTQAEVDVQAKVLAGLQDKVLTLETGIEAEKEAIAVADAHLVQLRTNVANLQDSDGRIQHEIEATKCATLEIRTQCEILKNIPPLPEIPSLEAEADAYETKLKRYRKRRYEDYLRTQRLWKVFEIFKMGCKVSKEISQLKAANANKLKDIKNFEPKTTQPGARLTTQP